jgi:hypothetical protein
MQAKQHASKKDSDVYDVWLPEFEQYSVRKMTAMVKNALDFWRREQEKVARAQNRVKSREARNRHNARWHYCNGMINRWHNTMRECLISHGLLVADVIPF